MSTFRHAKAVARREFNLTLWITIGFFGLFPVALGILSGTTALASGLAIGQGGLGLRRAIWGSASGFVGGALLAVVFAYLPASPWIHLIGFALWSALAALAVYWREKRYAARWLRVLTGPGEDRILPLLGTELRLGKLESNEIPLPFYQEIYPVHSSCAGPASTTRSWTTKPEGW
jgi:hypothetical protein